jgi:hypothetical protein
MKPDSTREHVGNAVKYNFVFCAARDVGEKGTFDSILNLKYFIHAVKFQWPSQKLLWPRNFPSFPCDPLETRCGSLGGIWCTLRTTALKHNSYFTKSRAYHLRQHSEILHPPYRVHLRTSYDSENKQ